MTEQQIIELEKELASACFILENLGEEPGFNGSILLIDDLSAKKIAEIINKTIECLAIQASDKVDAQEWISVDDRLPEFDKLKPKIIKVLCYFNDSPSAMAIISYEKMLDGKQEFNCWGNSYITHWMPLPTAPIDAAIKEGK